MVDGVSGTNSDLMYSSNTQSAPKQEMDKEAFLKILVNQLRYQNPMDPQDSDQFMNQIVQLSVMEQISNMSSSMDKLADSQEFNRATGLIGKEVKVLDGEDSVARGVVEKIAVKDGEPRMVINGDKYSMDKLVSINNPSAQELGYISSLVGKEVNLAGDNDTEIQGVVDKAIVKDGDYRLVVNGSEYGINRLISISEEPETTSSDGSTDTEESTS